MYDARLVKLNANIYLEWPDRSLRVFSNDNSMVNGSVFDSPQCSTPPIGSDSQFLDLLQGFLPDYAQTPFQSKAIKYNHIKPGQWFCVANPLTHGSTFIKLNNGNGVRFLYHKFEYIGEELDYENNPAADGYWLIEPTDLLNIRRPVVAAVKSEDVQLAQPTRLTRWPLLRILG